jgi:hypothetical protein
MYARQKICVIFYLFAFIFVFISFFIITVCSPRMILAEEVSFPNIKLNTDGTTEIHNEEQIAVNILDPNNVIAVWRDFRLGYRRVAFGRTLDGGETWHDELFVDPEWERYSDPGITMDAHGNFYVVNLALSGVSKPGNAIRVMKSTDKGLTWGEPVDAAYSNFGILDKELMACDRTGGATDGNLYVAWYDVLRGIRLSRSTNGAASFSNPVQLSDSGSVQWPVPAVGPNGEVYVGWLNFGGSLKFDRSFNAGITFGLDITITTVNITNEALNGGVDVLSFPAIDVDITDGPYRGRIYVSYLDRVNPAPDDTDIFFRYSDDQGENWSDYIIVNDDSLDGIDQFHPWTYVDEEGVVNVVWLDRRNDPENLKWDCYVARSFDGGLTFAPNVRVSTQSSAPMEAATEDTRAGLIGEYISITALAGQPHSVWTDTRDNNQNVYYAPLAGIDSDADGAPDESDVCPALADSRQGDKDSDGKGDFCDDDIDGDGFLNEEDTDADGDGIENPSDCAPYDSLVFDIPGEMSGLFFSSKTEIEWNGDASGASVKYHLYRGNIPGIGWVGYDHTCLAPDLSQPKSEDTAEPLEGSVYYYLSSGSNCFGEGSLGDSTSSGPRPNTDSCVP